MGQKYTHYMNVQSAADLFLFWFFSLQIVFALQVFLLYAYMIY